jgi:hypothetical protein
VDFAFFNSIKPQTAAIVFLCVDLVFGISSSGSLVSFESPFTKVHNPYVGMTLDLCSNNIITRCRLQAVLVVGSERKRTTTIKTG